MEEAFVLSREEAERLVEAMRDGYKWKCCGGPHTSYPRGNPHGHSVGCPVRDIHNALDPRGPLNDLRYGYQACGDPLPGPETGVQHPICRKPKGHDGHHTYV